MNNNEKNKLSNKTCVVSYRLNKYHSDMINNISAKIGCSRTKLIEYMVEAVASMPECDLSQLTADLKEIENQYKRDSADAFRRRFNR